MIRRLIAEFTLGFFLGGLPTLLVYLFGDQELLLQTIRGLSPNGLLLWYYIAVGVIAWVLLQYHRRTFVRDDHAKSRRALWGGVLKELPGASLGAMRAASGLLVAFAVLLLMDGASRDHMNDITWMFSSGFIGLLGCANVSENLYKRSPASRMVPNVIRYDR